MFCDGCGATVQAGQSYCCKCGKQIIGAIATTQSARGRVQTHSQLLAIFWLAFSALEGVGGLVLLVLGNGLFPHQLMHRPRLRIHAGRRCIPGEASRTRLIH